MERFGHGEWSNYETHHVCVAQSSNPQDATTPTSNPQEQSLGTYARSFRKDKKQDVAKRFDNDNLPREDKLSVVGNAAPTEDVAAQPADATAPPVGAGAAPETTKITPGQAPEDREKVIDQWQQKLSDQHAQVDALTQALDLDQREYRVHAAEYYNDPSQRASNQGQWVKDDAEFKQRIADEQKAVEDAKQKFGDLEEEARRSGVPNSVRESAEQQPGTSTQRPENSPQQP
jgi:hypothetical protein